MKQKRQQQLTLLDLLRQEICEHEFGKEEKVLQRISDILDNQPQILAMVYRDLNRGLKSKAGRNSKLTADQYLRVLITKLYYQIPYGELQWRILDSRALRWFCRLNSGELPDDSNLQRGLAKLRQPTLDKIQELIIQAAKKQAVACGKKLRLDTFVVESNISYPHDGKLLYETVAGLTRLLRWARRLGVKVEFHNRVRRSKKLWLKMANARGPNAAELQRVAYRELLKLTAEVLVWAQNLLPVVYWQARELYRELRPLLWLGRRIVNHARQRLLEGGEVAAQAKTLSLVEPHTDIICRGKKHKPAEFGHKIFIANGASNLITQYKLVRGNPADSEFFAAALAVHQQQFSAPPEAVSTDRRFYSQQNEELAQQTGIKYIALPRKGRKDKQRKRYERSWWFRRLQRFRAGIEGTISGLLRGYGLARAMWRRWQGFKRYVAATFMVYNLVKFACLTL